MEVSNLTQENKKLKQIVNFEKLILFDKEFGANLLEIFLDYILG